MICANHWKGVQFYSSYTGSSVSSILNWRTTLNPLRRASRIMKNMQQLGMKVSVVEDFSRLLKKSHLQNEQIKLGGNSLTNPITSGKLKCQRLPYVASHFLCCSVISPATKICQQLMVVSRTVWEGHEDRGTVTGVQGRCLSQSIDWARRLLQPLTQAGLAAPSPSSPAQLKWTVFKMWHDILSHSKSR